MSTLIDESGQEQCNLIQGTAPPNWRKRLGAMCNRLALKALGGTTKAIPPIAAIGLLKSARDALLSACSEARNGVTVGSIAGDHLDLHFHGVADREGACAIMRRFGVEHWVDLMPGCLTGQGEGFGLSVFFDEPADLKTAIAEALKPEPPF